MDTGLCYFLLNDGTIVCQSCSSPPEDSEWLASAPDGTTIGGVTDPRILARFKAE